jgi:hypothetical protein
MKVLVSAELDDPPGQRVQPAGNAIDKLQGGLAHQATRGA